MRNKENNTSVLFFDLRSGSVSATYSILTPTPSVIFSETKYVPFGRIYDTATFVDQCLRTLNGVVESSLMYLIHNNLPIPETIDIVYTSPWFKSHIIKKTTSSDSTHTMTTDIISRHTEDTFSELRTHTPPDSQIVESAHLSTTLNGYIVREPRGKKYTKCSISSYISTINNVVHSRVEETITRHFPHRKIRHRTLPVVMIEALQKMRPGYTGHLAIVHGEATDICSFRQGHLMHHESFPYGSHIPLKKLSGDLLSKEVYSLIGTSTVLPTKRGSEKDIIYASYREWESMFSLCIAKDTSTAHNNILLVSEDSIACMYAKNILTQKNSAANIEIFDKGHCIGHGIEVNSLSRDIHALSLMEACALK